MLPLSGGGGRTRVPSMQKSRRSDPRDPPASARGAGHGSAGGAGLGEQRAGAKRACEG